MQYIRLDFGMFTIDKKFLLHFELQILPLILDVQSQSPHLLSVVEVA